MLKTELGIYCDEDFVQEGGTMRELTVEISLSEYRDLIAGQTSDGALINKLNAEKEELEEENKKLKERIAAINAPMALEALREMLVMIFNRPSPLSNTVDDEDNNDDIEEADNVEET